MRHTTILLAAMTLALAGCATMGQDRATVSQLQMRIGDLEREITQKDNQISDLSYQVKDLSYEIDKMKTQVKKQGSTSTAVDSAKDAFYKARAEEMIRVSATPEEVQSALKSAGFYNGEIDGRLGNQTKNAIMSFQKSKGLKADGLIGKQTWTELQTYLQ